MSIQLAIHLQRKHHENQNSAQRSGNANPLLQSRCGYAQAYYNKLQGIIPAPESCHRVAATMREAKHYAGTDAAKTPLLNLSGHGHFDMSVISKVSWMIMNIQMRRRAKLFRPQMSKRLSLLDR
jgi:hypothetical protein